MAAPPDQRYEGLEETGKVGRCKDTYRGWKILSWPTVLAQTLQPLENVQLTLHLFAFLYVLHKQQNLLYNYVSCRYAYCRS